MRLRESKPPSECDEIVDLALNSIQQQPHLANRIFGSARWEELSLSAPHQVYLVALEDVSGGKILAHAAPSGWRYILLAGDQPLAAAEVVAIQQDGQERFAFSNFDYGPFFKNTIEGVRKVVPRLSNHPGDYELRVLNIPALHVFSLWLHQPNIPHDRKDVLVPLPPTNSVLKPFGVYTERLLAKCLHNVAVRQLEFDKSVFLDPEPSLSHSR